MAVGVLLEDLGQHVGLAQHQQILAVDLDLRAAILGVQDLVALGHVDRNAPAGFLAELAVADGEHLALLRLLLRGLGEDDAADGRLVLLDRPHDQAITERLELHRMFPPRPAIRSTFGTLMPRVPTFATECTARALPARTTVIAMPDEIGGVCAPPVERIWRQFT